MESILYEGRPETKKKNLFWIIRVMNTHSGQNQMASSKRSRSNMWKVPIKMDREVNTTPR